MLHKLNRRGLEYIESGSYRGIWWVFSIQIEGGRHEEGRHKCILDEEGSSEPKARFLVALSAGS